MQAEKNHPGVSSLSDLSLSDIFRIAYKYKLSILIVTALSVLITSIYLYFKPNIYSTYGIVEVKAASYKKDSDLISDVFADTRIEKVDKELTLLKTFAMNKPVLEKVDFEVRYFIIDNLKFVELYKKIPIKVKVLGVFDPKIYGKLVKLTPHENHFTLEIAHKSLLNRFLSHIGLDTLIANEHNITLDTNKTYAYGKSVETPYFEIEISKLAPTLQEPIYFSLMGSSEEIFASVKEQLKVTQVSKKAPLVKVIFEDTIPERAEQYVNTLLDTLISSDTKEKKEKTKNLISFLESQLKEAKTKLDIYESKLELYKKQNQALKPSQQALNYINEMNKLDNKISELQLKRELIKSVVNNLKNNDDSNVIIASLSKIDAPAVRTLIGKLQEKMMRMEALRAKYSYLHPSMRPLRREIHQIKKSIRSNLQNLLARINNQIASTKQLKRTYAKKLETLPGKERVLIGIKRDYEITSKHYNYLLKEKAKAQMIHSSIKPGYHIIERANITNPVPIKPKKKLLLLLGGVIGFFIGLMQAILRYILDDKIKSRQELEQLTNLPVYGVIPQIKKRNVKLEVFEDTRSPYTEAMRSLRTNLKFSLSEENSHVIILTSTTMGEGKTTTSANLGAILQIAGFKVVVINLDMRKPVLHKYFSVNNNVGMSTFLSGKSSLDDIIVPTEYNGLDVITSGPIPPNPAELMMSKRFGNLIEELKKHYDYIVVDTPPLGLVSDTMEIMRFATLSLIVVRENYSKRAYIKDLNGLVQRHKLKHIGIVLNGSNLSSGSYGYGYGYGYGE